jgi:hypothetical protein
VLDLSGLGVLSAGWSDGAQVRAAVSRMKSLLLSAALLGACATRSSETDATREAREAMLFMVASQFREHPGALEVVRFERVTWRDRCFEIRRRGECQRQPTPGYRLRLKRRGQTYEYRAPLSSPTDVALAAGPDPRIDTPALTWTWSPAAGDCHALLISTDARPAVGWCGGPLAQIDWLDQLPSREEWVYLYRRFAPFRLRTGDRTLVFSGIGAETASTAWQRALEAWASLRWSDLRTGRSGAAHGRAMAYGPPIANRAGYCDVLEVTEYGVAYVGSALCAGGGGEPGRVAWLSDELWKQFSAWLDEWGAYSNEANGLHFFGRGKRALGPAEVRLLSDWATRAMTHVRSR